MHTVLQAIIIFFACVVVLNLYFKITRWIESVTFRNYARGMMYKAIADTLSDAFNDVNRKNNLRLVKGEKTNGKGNTDS